MAFATEIHGVNADITGRIAATFRSLAQRVATYRIYRKTVNELSALSTRELNDLGISRSMIKSTALEAAYGV